MADYTKEELSGMNRLALRRICKENGMTSTNCAQMDFDDMVGWILGEDGDPKEEKSGKGKGKSAKGGKAAGAKGGKAAGAKGGKAASAKGGRKPPAKGGKPKASAKDETKDDDSAEGGVDLSQIESKLDTIGTMLDENFGAMDENIKGLVELVNELSIEVYKGKGMTRHLGDWLEAEDICQADNAPGGLGFQEKEDELEAECQGEDEGGEE